MARRSTTRSGRMYRWLAVGGVIAAAIAVAVIGGTSVLTRASAEPTSQPVASAAVPTSPPATPAPPPTEKPAIIVALDVPDGRYPTTVAVVDESGHLVDAVPAPNMPPAPTPVRGETWAFAVDGQPNQLRIGWLGGACDGPSRLTIRADGRTIERIAEPRGVGQNQPCILIGIDRGVVLMFDRPVTIDDIEVVGAIAGPHVVRLWDATVRPLVAALRPAGTRPESR